MATKKREKAEKTLSGVINDECSCPVCLEDFLEPKSLPNCAHNVCRKCLEGMATDSESKEIRCPVCRKESTLPEDGINGLPTNCLIVKLLEATPGRIERLEIRRCIGAVKEEIESVSRDERKLEIQKQERLERAAVIKTDITRAADRLVEIIRKQEQELIRKVNGLLEKDIELLGYENRKQECKRVRLDLERYVSTAESILKENSSVALVEMRDKVIANGKTLQNNAKGIYTVEPHSSILLARFEETDCFEIFSGFGRIKTGTESDEENPPTNGRYSVVGNFRNSIDCRLAAPESFDLSLPVFQFATITQTLTAGSLGLEVLSPLAITSHWSRNEIAVAEPENNRILVLNTQGRLKRRVCGAAPYSGVAFSGDGELITVFGAKDLVFIDPQNGKNTGSVRTTDHGVRHRSITCDTNGRFVVTSEPSSMFYKSSVCVYGSNSMNMQSAILKFTCYGSSLTSSPFKALYHRGEYFVSDTARGCIMVYNGQGAFVRQFGGWSSSMRRGNGRGRSEFGELTSPTGIVIDQSGDNILVCDVNSKSIQMYSTAGQFVGRYVMEGRPSDITVLRDGTIVVCSKADHWIKFLSLNDPE
ncbi:predicted protein [Nematostella vectensis]|uniref:RING-type domain-containing protein n=1 Tax=Nematostella vectensis TaxID=45351 RepID=A7RYU7_NEMVE|nr:uncharacterized protein LOC5515319 [Nematostella vectensis]EDO43383.1 predicted protein [Nematostella vectensis]|eukprot:XP_001635446.1 predicted protein [Nematostella vectensis]